MLDVDKSLKRIQEILASTTERTPISSKEKFKTLKMLDEAYQLANMCFYATESEKIYRLSETIDRMQKSIVNTLSDSDALKYYMTDWWLDL